MFKGRMGSSYRVHQPISSHWHSSCEQFSPTVVRSKSRVILSKDEQFIGQLVPQVIPLLVLAEMDLAIVVDIFLVDDRGFGQVVLDVDSGCVAHCQRPVLERTTQGLPDAVFRSVAQARSFFFRHRT